jgi:hypothetical protein
MLMTMTTTGMGIIFRDGKISLRNLSKDKLKKSSLQRINFWNQHPAPDGGPTLKSSCCTDVNMGFLMLLNTFPT